MSGIPASKEKVKSPSTYGKEANKNYRQKEKKNENKNNPDKGSKYSERQMRYNVSRQDKLHGQKRTKIVSDFTYTTVIAQLLKNLDFPVHKNTIVEFILHKDSEDSSQITELLSLLQQIQERYYKNVNDVIAALDLVREAT